MQVFLKMRRLFFPFSALQVILVSDLHRLTEGSAQTRVPLPGQEAAPGAGAAAFCPPAKSDPHHLRAGARFSRSPQECRARPEGKNPKEVIKGGRGVITRHDKRQQGSFFSRGHV